ncbi:hypothetical protein [Streptacidiphilus sp. PAMC 29251]
MIAATGSLLSFAFAPLPANGRIGMSDVGRISEGQILVRAVGDRWMGVMQLYEDAPLIRPIV